MKKTVFGIVAFTLFFAIGIPDVSWAAMGSVQNFSYLRDVSADKLGPQRSFKPDGKLDVGFSLLIKGTGALRNVSLRKAGTDQIWETRGGAERPLLLVTDDEGKALNSPSGMSLYAFVLGARLNLWVNDAPTLLANDSRFDVVVTFVDGSNAKASVKVPARKIASPSPTPVPAKPTESVTTNKFVSADYVGQGEYDFVASEHRLQSNLRPDHRIDVRVEGPGILSAVKIKDPDRTDKGWDTVPGSPLPLLAVTDSNTRILNRNDGSIAVSLGGRSHTLSLWIDGEELEKSKRFTVTLLFSDGKVQSQTTSIKANQTTTVSAPTQKAPEPQKTEETKPEENAANREIVLVAKPAPLKRGLVAKSENLKGTPGKNNVSMIVKVLGTGTITSIELENRTGPGAWDTIQKNGRPIIMVREQTRVLNRANGSVTIPVKTKGEYELIVEDNGSLKKANARFLLTVTWDDDTESQAVLNW